MDLSLVPISELIQEIDKRCDSNVILAHRLVNNKDVFDYHINGNKMTIIGLMEIAKFKLNDDFTNDDSGEFFID